MTVDVQVGTPWSRELPDLPLHAEVGGWFRRSAYLDVGATCNQDCGYCFQDRTSGWRPLEALLQQLEVAVAHGVDTIFLIGGEPTIYPDFWQVVEAIKAAGVARWGLFTNGVRLADRRYMDRLMAAGLGMVHLSFDSPRPDVQAKMSRNRRLFQRLERAFANLGRYPELTLVTNAVITVDNVGHLEEMVDFAADLRARYGLRPLVSFTQCKPGGFVEEELIVPSTEAAAAVLRAVQRAAEVELPVAYRNLPYCLMDGHASLSTDWTSGTFLLHADGHLELSPDLALTKLERCGECAHFHECPGVLAKMLDRFGGAEFQPVRQSATAERAAAYRDGWRQMRRLSPQGGEVAPSSPSPSPPTPLESPSGEARAHAERHDELRVVVRDLQDGAPVHLGVDELTALALPLDQARRVVLTGAEVTVHPELPGLIAALAAKTEVWIETTAVTLASPARAQLLRQRGLSGICWLHLPNDAHLYRKLLRRPRRARDLTAIARSVVEAGLAVEHRFLAVREPLEALRRRVREVWAAAPPSGVSTWADLPFHEGWWRWLDTAPMPEPAAVGRQLSSVVPELQPLLGPQAGGGALEPLREGPDGPSRTGRPASTAQTGAAAEPPAAKREEEPTATVLLGNRCNFRCEFCYLPNHTALAKKDAVLAGVREVVDAGYRKFFVAGGEPTLYPHLFEVLAILRDVGAEIMLVTNGARISEPGFCDKLTAHGVGAVLLSFHGHTGELYDAIAQRKGVFPSIMAAYDALAEHGMHVLVHHVLYERNYRLFPEFMRFFVERLWRPGQVDLSISNVLLYNETFAAGLQSYPRLSAVRPFFDAGMAVAEAAGVEVGRGTSADGFPECVFGVDEQAGPPDARWIAENTNARLGLIFAGQPAALHDLDRFDVRDYNQLYTHVDACSGCARRPFCVGIQRKYIERFGAAEFSAIPAAPEAAGARHEP